ncbi:TPA: hypothetical protein HA251_00195 [Candidatus Woesearchaeota archaeon]|nr:hypothetical protein [Candidatus Woesearchaeota archaeon]
MTPQATTSQSTDAQCTPSQGDLAQKSDKNAVAPSIFALGERIDRLERIANTIKRRRIAVPNDNESADAFLRTIFPTTDPNIWANHRRYWTARRIYEKAMQTKEYDAKEFQGLLEKHAGVYLGRKQSDIRAHRPQLLVGVGDTAYWGPRDGHYTSVLVALNNAKGLHYTTRHHTSGLPPELQLRLMTNDLETRHPNFNVKIYMGKPQETRDGEKILGIAI